MEFCILASGSRGNSIYVADQQTRILVDVGLSAKNIEGRLAQHNLDPQRIDAIILTHAHRDHTQGVGVLANRYKIPIRAHEEVLRVIGRFLKPGQETQIWQGAFALNTMRITPFKLPHDCDPTYGYVIESGRSKLAICTDLGHVTDTVVEHISDIDALILESNHDPVMLERGSYPIDLKQRITGRWGHLSNHEAGELLSEIAGTRLKLVILGHLSLHNNTPELALKTVSEYVEDRTDLKIDVIEQKTVSELYRIT